MKAIKIEKATKEAKNTSTNYVVGIDLGTTNSLAVIYEKENTPRILVDVTPSIVTFFEDGKIESCNIENVKRNIGKTIFSIKRKVGMENAKIEIFNKVYSPEEVSAFILKHIKNKCEEVLKYEVKDVVITVPAYFDDTQRNATKMAAKMAGFNDPRLLNEPTAAAVFFDIENKEEGIYAVFDLGGGTFDISILQMKMGVIKVIGVGGDTKIGGDDFDYILAEHFKVSNFEAKKIKEEICINGFYEGPHGGMTLDEFDSKVIHIIHNLIRIFKDTLNQVEISIPELKGIVLVGGSTKMPIVREAMKYEFDTEIFLNVDPDRIVAMGAGLFAYNIQNRIGNLLLDVVPITLGIETSSEMVLKIIPRNSNIPIEVVEELTTGVDNQTGILIHVVQGEREFVKDCRSLARFELSGIPPMPRGVPQINITFKVDVDGILSVTAIERISQKAAFIEIRPTYKINYKDVKDMFEDAMKHGKDDMQKRLLEETKIEANMVLEAAKIYNFKHKNKMLDALILALEGAIKSNIVQDIKNQIENIKDVVSK